VRRALEALLRWFTPERASAVCLGVAVAAGFAAWGFQASAAHALDEAGYFQGKEVPSQGAPPPNVRQYRAILDSLDAAIAVRRRIDELLARAENVVAALKRRQSASTDAAALSKAELATIARTLGGAVKAARSSFGRLQDVERRLRVSAQLAARIAEELEELDRKLGPTAARP
jgi:hypothetical protein